MEHKYYVTASGYEQLKNDLETLKSQGRKDVAEKIKIARSYGDLSENAEYDEAKKEQAFVEGEIIRLEKISIYYNRYFYLILYNNCELLNLYP